MAEPGLGEEVVAAEPVVATEAIGDPDTPQPEEKREREADTPDVHDEANKYELTSEGTAGGRGGVKKIWFVKEKPDETSSNTSAAPGKSQGSPWSLKRFESLVRHHGPSPKREEENGSDEAYQPPLRRKSGDDLSATSVHIVTFRPKSDETIHDTTQRAIEVTW